MICCSSSGCLRSFLLVYSAFSSCTDPTFQKLKKQAKKKGTTFLWATSETLFVRRQGLARPEKCSLVRLLRIFSYRVPVKRVRDAPKERRFIFSVLWYESLVQQLIPGACETSSPQYHELTLRHIYIKLAGCTLHVKWISIYLVRKAFCLQCTFQYAKRRKARKEYAASASKHKESVLLT